MGREVLAQGLLKSVSESLTIQKGRREPHMKAKYLFSDLRAIANSSHFTPYTDGVTVTLPNGETITVKLKRTFRSLRPVGLRLSKFAFITEVSAGDVIGVGYGEDNSKLLAVQKSIAEGVERVIFHSVKNTSHGTSNSNGWAAHVNREKAFASALDELLERDAVLVHWLCRQPMLEVKSESWPRWLLTWAAKELSQGSRFMTLRILVSSKGHLPTATTVLLDPDGFAVLSHATADNLDTAIYKALVETCRIAQMALENIAADSSLKLKNQNETISARPEDHAMFYAFHSKLPAWLFGEEISWLYAAGNWRFVREKFKKENLKPNFFQIASGPLVIGYATCDLTQGLYFGQTEVAQRRGLINLNRLEKVGLKESFNLMPHCVP
jgi:hypothetical protein